LINTCAPPNNEKSPSSVSTEEGLG
jgi:hypothetical protein